VCHKCFPPHRSSSFAPRSRRRASRAKRWRSASTRCRSTRIAPESPVAWAQQAWLDADEKLKQAKEKAAQAALEAYKAGNALPPTLQDGSTVRDLNLLIPRPRPASASEAAAFDLQRAQADADAATADLTAAKQAEAEITADVNRDDRDVHPARRGTLVLEQRLTNLQSEEDRRIEREAAQLARRLQRRQEQQGPGRGGRGAEGRDVRAAAARQAL
jgi:hypothetical protein